MSVTDLPRRSMAAPAEQIGEFGTAAEQWRKEVKVVEPPHEPPAPPARAVKVEKGHPPVAPKLPPPLLRARPKPRKTVWWH